MLQGWLIYTKQDALENESYIHWFIEEASKQQIDLQLMYREHLQVGITEHNPTILYDNQRLKLPNFAVVRTIEPIVQQVFQSFMIPTFNSYRVTHMTNHKSRTYLAMNELGIPVLPTFFSTKEAFPTYPPLPYPFIVKEAIGRGGKQVHYVHTYQNWQTVKDLIQSNDIIIQDANVQLGRDLRVFVIGKEIIASVLRKSDCDFRANFTLGGTAELYSLAPEQVEMINKIIHYFDFGLVGIDFLIGHDGKLIFNEIEDVVGSRILSATTDINLLKKYVTYIKKQVIRKNVSN